MHIQRQVLDYPLWYWSLGKKGEESNAERGMSGISVGEVTCARE